ncbi:tbc1 domain family member 14 [Stylonychia lemnae]|uniref:Tbc1 domain family member 14 n=1 Tax=Stylonychia lemnae TaxID=5949 RepID=A0A078AAH4_STYLE|nr:tbc1 domain family member 14 [Stylonychia lemnae]|eukprot:CDW78866.1 tbc1 domain family member 14 [Stylonychia lemnae]
MNPVITKEEQTQLTTLSANFFNQPAPINDLKIGKIKSTSNPFRMPFSSNNNKMPVIQQQRSDSKSEDQKYSPPSSAQKPKPQVIDVNQMIIKLERKLVKIRDDNRLKEKEQQMFQLRKEIKELEQDLLLTKIDLAQAKGELDEYEYQIDEYKRVIKQENQDSQNSSTDQTQDKESSRSQRNQSKTKTVFKYKNMIKYPVSLLTKTQIVNQVKVPKFLKKLNPFSGNSGNSGHSSQNVLDDPIFGSDSIDDTPKNTNKKQPDNLQFSELDMGISTTVSMAAPMRDIRQETLSAAVYLNYFQKTHDEKHIDQWFKVYIPLIKEGYDEEFRKNKKLKQEIVSGIPVPLRGQVWQALVGNKLRISSFLFQVFKDNGQHDYNMDPDNPRIKLNPLIEEDIPRTFPHLNDLFEEIQSLSTSLREILLAYQNFRQDIGYVQGMSYVAGMLLLHCGPPEECFKVFCNILNMEIIFNFYNFKISEINKTYKVYWKLLKEQAPLLYDNLKADNVSCSVFLFEWVLTLFSSSFEIEICTYLWDQIFFFGDMYIVKIAVTICYLLQKKFINEIKTVDGLAIIKKGRLHLQKDELFDALNKIKLDLSYIESLYAKLDAIEDEQ